MARLQLSFASRLYDRMQPLYTGEVKPDGIDLNFIAIDQPRPIFDRMSGGEEFDVGRVFELRVHAALRQQAVPLRRHSGVSFDRLPYGLHRHQQKAGIKRPRISKASGSACRSTR